MARDPYQESATLQRAGNLLRILGWVFISSGVAVFGAETLQAGGTDIEWSTAVDLWVIGAVFLLVGYLVHTLGRPLPAEWKDYCWRCTSLSCGGVDCVF